MEERVGFLVNTVEQLAEKLEAYGAGKRGESKSMYQGQVKRNREALSFVAPAIDLQQAVDKWMANQKLSKLLELWVKGFELDWNKLYGEDCSRGASVCRRIRLPESGIGSKQQIRCSSREQVPVWLYCTHCFTSIRRV